MKITKNKTCEFVNADCFDWFKINKKKYDVCITSPPYNDVGMKDLDKIIVGKKEGWKPKYLNQDWINDYDKFLVNFTKETLKICDFMFLNIQMLANNKKDICYLMNEMKDYLIDIAIWNKGNGMPPGVNMKVMKSTFEFIFIFSNKPNPNKTFGNKVWDGNFINNVWNLKNNSSNEYSKIHKALFPVNFPYYILKNFFKEESKVLDIFGGLATTGIAANELNMSFTMIEKDETYYKKSIERFKMERNTIFNTLEDFEEVEQYYIVEK